MKGSGTQTDPYIVDIWEDFVTAIQIPDVFVAFPPEPGVIDMSEYGYFTETLATIACAQIDGNGWTIRGLSATDCSLFTTEKSKEITINWLLFKDIKLLARTKQTVLLYSGTYTNVYFNGKDEDNPCVISGEIDGSVSTASAAFFARNNAYSGDTCFDCCSITANLKGYAYLRMGDQYEPYNNCNIKLTGFVAGNTYPIIDGELTYCYVSGNVEIKSATTAVRLYHTSAYNIFDIELINGSSADQLNFVSNGSSNGTPSSLVNTDKIKGWETVSLREIEYIGVTESQLYDDVYLKSVGFDIEVRT